MAEFVNQQPRHSGVVLRIPGGVRLRVADDAVAFARPTRRLHARTVVAFGGDEQRHDHEHPIRRYAEVRREPGEIDGAFQGRSDAAIHRIVQRAMTLEEIVRATVDREPPRCCDEAPGFGGGRGPSSTRVEWNAFPELGRIGQPDRDGHHLRLAHTVALAQSTSEQHRFVVALRSKELVDVGAVLGKVGRTELLTAGELEDDRDQLDATVNADAQFFRLRRYLRQRKDNQEGESRRAKRHDHPSLVYSADSTRLARDPPPPTLCCAPTHSLPNSLPSA